MKIGLRKAIEDLIAAYQGSREVAIESMREVIDEWKDKVNIYQADHIHKQIKDGLESVVSNVTKVNTTLNQKLNALVQGTKEKVMPLYVTEFEKPADYETQISNALRYLDIEGEDITDDSAYPILKKFIDDHDQMKLFKNIIKKRVKANGGQMEDANGKSTFPKTFGKLNEIEMILDIFNEMESIAEKLFMHDKENGETFIINGYKYSLPIESYEEIASEEGIVALAKKLEDELKKIDGVEQVANQTA
ncbi:hypothetical protein [Tepidibacillus decaturensis]|uniref:Uncharacterized protein n=1 Tax=Tepidibacillus decaturensis TaxID=1413211 RepID=A0A135L0Y2_9BACI|nr:hypothetical protein [Tepidibacillus decaturensis]KXG42658.1 hypothetical protein U473_00300 [Tepidibacillus decaturensis]